MAFVSLGTNVFLGKATSTIHGAKDRKTSNGYSVQMNAQRTFVSPRPSFSSIDTPENAQVLSDLSNETKEQVITAAYKQIFGNCYIMESEKGELGKIESDFKGNTMSVRELVRGFGKSEEYRKRYFERTSPYGFIELNFKHFLGRAPHSQEEVSFHVRKLQNEGYDAEIDSYMDSDEYAEKFDEFIVPRFIFEGQYEKNDYFNRMCLMRKHWDGCSTSTVSGSTAPAKPIPSKLILSKGQYVTGSPGILKGLPAGFRPEFQEKKFPSLPLNSNAPVRMRIKVAENLFQVFEIPPLMAKDIEPEWKKEKMAEKPKGWNGVWY